MDPKKLYETLKPEIQKAGDASKRPCKFFYGKRGCMHGDKCKFFHGE